MSPGELKATAAGMMWEAHVPSSFHLPQGQGASDNHRCFEIQVTKYLIDKINGNLGHAP